MTPRQFLVVAEDLFEGDTEAHWRSAVSRAYYASFHAGRHLLEKCGFRTPESERGHRHVSDRLSNSGHDGIRAAGVSLDTLRGFRNLADYNLSAVFSRLTADRQIEAAKAIIEALEAVEADTAALTAVTQAMRDYERGRGDVTWKG